MLQFPIFNKLPIFVPEKYLVHCIKMNDLKFMLVMWLIIHLVQGGSTFKTSNSFISNLLLNQIEENELTKRNAEEGELTSIFLTIHTYVAICILQKTEIF